MKICYNVDLYMILDLGFYGWRIIRIYYKTLFLCSLLP